MAYNVPTNHTHQRPEVVPVPTPSQRAALAAASKVAARQTARRAAMQAADLARWHTKLGAPITPHGPKRSLADYEAMATGQPDPWRNERGVDKHAPLEG